MNKSILTKPLLLSRNTYLIIGVLIVLAYYIPFFIFGENTYVHVHDILDIDVAHTKMLVDQHAIFDYDKTLPILDGVPRSEYFICFSPYDFKMLFYSIMPTFWAYLTNSLLVRLLAFIGMFLLLSRYLLKEENTRYYKFIAFICAIIFALIPFYTTFGLSSAGIPLLTWAFLNLRDKQHLVLSYLSIAFFANYSCLALSGVFVCLVFGCYYLYLAIKSKDWQIHIMLGVLLLGITYAITNIDILINIFNEKFVPHRNSFYTLASFQLLKANIKTLIWETQAHCGKVKIVPIIIFVLIAILFDKHIEKRLLYTLLAICGISTVTLTAQIIKMFVHIPLFQYFAFDRFYFFLPSLWIVTMALSFEIITKKKQILPVLLAVLIYVPIVYNNNDELMSVTYQVIRQEPKHPTYRQFYDEKLFGQISKTLKIIPNETKVVSIGLFPAIAEYNGYHTLDTYINIYPLEYKLKFREIIEPELNKNDKLKVYFDSWGSRCYMFSSELEEAVELKKIEQYMVNKNAHISINPQYNISALKQLGAQYIFSAAQLQNYQSLSLQECGVFTTNESFWKIYVYQIK